jgi:hypothetical protein
MADDGVEPPPPDEAVARGPSKVVIQMNKLKEANNKYKSLLMLAKDRISTQQEEMDALKGTILLIKTNGGN